MIIKYLGTAAYEGIPALFCDCPICRHARLVGGKELKTRQQALINDELLIDLGPDSVAHDHMYRLNWNNIHNILVTHTHADHFSIKDFEIIKNFHSHQEHKRVDIYGGQSMIDLINQSFAHPKAKEELESIGKQVLVKAGDILSFDGYRVLVVEANHPSKTCPFVYVIEKDNKRILYAHDTGMLSDESFKLIASFGHLDLVSFDCSGGNLPAQYDYHLSFPSVKESVEKLIQLGSVDDNTVKVISHFSHSGNITHEEMVKVASESGYIVAYDGLEISL